MIDLAKLRRMIANAPASGPAAILTRDTLEEFERDLRSGAQARIELARVKMFGAGHGQLQEGVGG